MQYLSTILFGILFGITLFYFLYNLQKLKKKIRIGKPISDSIPKKNLYNVLRVAFGQPKMGRHIIAGILHTLVYISFFLLNIELLEIIIDGFFGTHRFFQPYLGKKYIFLISFLEVLGVLVFVSVAFFWIRRNMLPIKRFSKKEIHRSARRDANQILYFEAVIMCFFLMMNASDYQKIALSQPNGVSESAFLVSQHLSIFLKSLSIDTLFLVERIFWWGHIMGIFAFLNYLFFSKHLHIFLAFPNAYYTSSLPLGKMQNIKAIMQEVKNMVVPSEQSVQTTSSIETLGASDVNDLNRLELLNAYTCTECGRCDEVCPAHQTGKKLSPRAIMMKTRRRADEYEKNPKSELKLLDGYISREELWACTTCGACIEECPLSINPMSIILKMRQYISMEEAKAPAQLTTMMDTIENTNVVWPFDNNDRGDWQE